MKKFSLSSLIFISALFLFSCDETSDPGSGEFTKEGSLAFTTDGTSSAVGGPVGGGGGTQQNPGVITAGEWNDLEEWNFWKKLISNDTFATHLKNWGVIPLTRYSVLVKDQNGSVIVDANVQVKADDGQIMWEGRSDNSGRAELWPSLFADRTNPKTTVVTYQNKSYSFFQPKVYEQGANVLTIAANATTSNAVDVMFVVDATGSMGDELEYLKTELLDVLNRAAQTPNITLRTGSVFYRDAGDEYVTRSSAFTTTRSTTVDFVKNQSAAGGGDWPEAVHDALENAIVQQSWSSTAKARLLFLVLDAPPHEDTNVKLKMMEMTKLAAAKGIKIIPVTASGIDKGTEFLMRSISAATNGTYVFITNHSGIGNEHIEATVGDYEVEYLNDLMVRLINKYSL